MAFAQLTFRESLRDIEACLNAQPSKLYGMGFRNPVARSTLATRTSNAIGACGMILPPFWSVARANSIPTKTSGSISTIRSSSRQHHDRFVSFPIPVGRF